MLAISVAKINNRTGHNEALNKKQATCRNKKKKAEH